MDGSATRWKRDKSNRFIGGIYVRKKPEIGYISLDLPALASTKSHSDLFLNNLIWKLKYIHSKKNAMFDV